MRCTVPIIIKIEVTIHQLASHCPTLAMKSIKLSLWTFQVQGLNIIETVISLYSSMAMNGSVEGIAETLKPDDRNYQNFLQKVQMAFYHFQINVLYICDDTHIHWMLTSVF